MNTAFKTYFRKALHDAKIAALKKDYSARKTVSSIHDDFELGDGVKADVFIERKKGKSLVFEIVVLPSSPHQKKKIKQIREKIQDRNYDFRLVTIAQPATPGIEIGWFDDKLFKYFIKHKQDVIALMSRDAQYEKLDTEIQSIEIIHAQAVSTYVYGNAQVSLPYGNHLEETKQGDRQLSYTFPFEGKFFLNLCEEEIEGEEGVIMDTSSWY
ncbi:MAG: hypothetical protein GY862_15875 [Gammaproteobacteria bacterium]|nr:hypothetical protein [Gammaproteobacteria bacterium]